MWVWLGFFGWFLCTDVTFNSIALLPLFYSEIVMPSLFPVVNEELKLSILKVLKINSYPSQPYLTSPNTLLEMLDDEMPDGVRLNHSLVGMNAVCAATPTFFFF